MKNEQEIKKAKRFDEVVVFKLLQNKTTPRITEQYKKIGLDKMKDLESYNSAYFQGKVRAGKTMAAVYCAVQIYKNHYMQGGPRPSFAFVSISDLLAEIRESFKPDSEITELKIVEKYTSYDILILDDLGVEPTTEWVIRTLYLIINRLYENMKTVFITSNLPIDQLSKIFPDERISRRINDMCEIIELTGKHFE
jgi:DNA replication protein DnaC